MKRPLAYITAPWSENEFENTENAAKYCRAVYDAGFSPVCPTLFLPLFLRDEIPQEHKDCMQSKKEWLQNLTGLLKVYLNDYHQMTRLHFDRFDGKPEIFDFYYDMSIHASNIDVEIHQGTFNKALSFSPDQYCREAFGYDSVAMSEKFDALHAFVEMIEIDCPGSKEIAQQFATVHSELRKLNSAVYGAIRDLDVRLADIQKTIV